MAAQLLQQPGRAEAPGDEGEQAYARDQTDPAPGQGAAGALGGRGARCARAGPVGAGDVVGGDGAVDPQAVHVRLPHADARGLEQEAVDRVIGDAALQIAQQAVARRLVRGGVHLGQQGVEGGAVVAEVVVLAAVDVVVHRLDVLDDGQVELAALEHLIQPLGPFQILDLRADARLRQLRDQHLAAAPGVGARRQAQGHVDAVGIARLGQQGARPGRVMRIEAGQVDITRRLARIVAADRLAEAEHGALYQGVAVDGVGQGAAHPHVVERRLGVVDPQNDLAFGGADDDAEARVALELGHVLGRGIVGEGVHVARADGGEGGGRVADEAEDDGVQARVRAPVAVAADQGQLAAALPALQLERAGADRRDGVGRGGLGRDHDRVAPGQDIGQGGHRPRQMDAQGRRVDDLDGADRLEQGLLGVGRALGGDAVEREFGDSRVERRAVGEGHAAPQMEGPGQAVGRGLPRLGQRGGDGPVLGQPGQALEDVGVDDFIHRRRRA